MAKTELMVLFKKMQRDDKKDVLKFEYRGGKDSAESEEPKKINIPQSVYALVGEMVNIEVEGCKSGPITAELQKANKDSKKVVLDLALRGDSEEKALDLYRKAGQNVKLFIEPSQSSLLENESKPKNDHEGIEYAVALDGSVDLKKEEALPEVAAVVEDVKEEDWDEEEADNVDADQLDDDELPF